MCKTSVCFTSIFPLSLAATSIDPHRTSACCAGQVFDALPSPWPVSHSHRLVWCEREHQPNYGNVCLSTNLQKYKPPTPAVCQSPCLHKWGYSKARPVCWGVNLWKYWYKIGYQSQQACCFKLIPLSPGKLLLCKSPEDPSNVFPSATWSRTDRVMQLPVLSTLNAQQGQSNTPFQHGSQEALENHIAK